MFATNAIIIVAMVTILALLICSICIIRLILKAWREEIRLNKDMLLHMKKLIQLIPTDSNFSDPDLEQKEEPCEKK